VPLRLPTAPAARARPARGGDAQSGRARDGRRIVRLRWRLGPRRCHAAGRPLLYSQLLLRSALGASPFRAVRHSGRRYRGAALKEKQARPPQRHPPLAGVHLLWLVLRVNHHTNLSKRSPHEIPRPPDQTTTRKKG
jgi:hypothetical protein